MSKISNVILMLQYLENDYYGAVASCGIIDNNYLYYAFICDSGVLVYNKNGQIKFQTEDEKKLYSDPYINNIGIPWNLPESRRIVRSEYRNNPDKIVDNKCVSYGALTGEENAIKFIRTGKVSLEKDDTVVIYSDGFTNFLNLKEFIKQVVDFDKYKFEEYVNNKSLTNYEKFGKDKTLIIMKN